MKERSSEELTLRDILETLWRQRIWLFSLPALFGAIALIYGFLIAKPIYTSATTISIPPKQIQAQLEQQTQVQWQNPLTFQELKAIAYSEKVIEEVWKTLEKEGKLPTHWQNQGNIPGIGQMLRDLKMGESARTASPSIVVTLTVQAASPEVAAMAANVWASATVREINGFITTPLRNKLGTLEEMASSAKKVYQKAQSQWEAFARSNTLEQDQAELVFLQGIPLGESSPQTLLVTELPGERLRLLKELTDLELTLANANPEQKSILLSRKRSIEENLKRVEDRIAFLRERISKAQAEQERLRQELVVAKNAYLALVQKKTDLQIELASSQNSLAQVIAPAYPIYEKVAPKRGLIFALALALGLMLGVMAAFVAEALRAEEAPKAA